MKNNSGGNSIIYDFFGFSKSPKKSQNPKSAVSPLPLAKLYKEKKFFVKNILCVKNSIAKKFRKTDHRFGFVDLDYLRSTLIKNNFFVKKVFLCLKKWSTKKLKKLTSDSNSSTPITLRSTLIKMFLLYLYLILWSISEVRTHKQSSNKAIRQFMFVRLFSTRKRIK
jgi:hypothetical protein